VALGYFWLGEKLTLFTLLAFATIASGVYLVNYGYRKQHEKLA
jgi:drug/metabolite transporter (DMT)-like permease